MGVLTALPLAGCGGDDDFDGRARSICADWREKVEANPLPTVRGVRDRPVAGAYFARQARIWRDAQAKLQELTPPGDDESAYEAYVSDIGRTATTYQQLSEAEFAGDGPRITGVARQLQADRDRLLRSAETAGQSECLE